MGKHTLLVAFNIFLLLSVTPLEAKRVHATISQHSTKLVETKQTSETQWLFGANKETRCARMKTEFEGKSEELRASTASLRESGGVLTTASTVMKLRGTTRVYQRAATQNCEWVQGNDANTTALESTVQENLADNACFGQARALLTYEWDSPQAQSRAMAIATRMLLEQSCTDDDFVQMVEEMNAAETQSEVDEDTDPIETLEALSEDTDNEVEQFTDALMTEAGSSLLQTDAAAAFISTLEQLVALVAFLLVWAIMCVVFVPVILMVIGAVLCTLSWVLSRFVRSHHSNLGSCMNYWAFQTQTMFAPGNELITAGVCLIAGWFGAVPHAHVYFPSLPRVHIWVR